MKLNDLRLAATMALIILLSVTVQAQYYEPGNYDDWNYNPTRVYGIKKLTQTRDRAYYHLSKTDASTIKIQYYNETGIADYSHLVRFVNGKISTMISTDKYGFVYQVYKFTPVGPDALLVTSKRMGENYYLPCKAVKYIYKNNLLTELHYLGYSNKPGIKNGVSVIKYKRYDDKNRFSLLKEMSFFDENNQPVISQSYDCHKMLYEYSERGNNLSSSCYGIAGEPVKNRYGVFMYRYQYDENDNRVKQQNIGLNNELISNIHGVAEFDNEYTHGLKTLETRYNEKRQISRPGESGDGAAIIRYEYDERGNMIRQSYFDEDNKPVNNDAGYHTVRYSYSPADMLTDIAYYDLNNKEQNDRHGIHHYHYDRNIKGQNTGISYFDASGQPVKDDHDEVFMCKYKYDEEGRQVSQSFWKDDGTPMNRWDGFHEDVTRYDNEGQIVEELYLDEKGNAFTSSTGYSRLVQVFNSNAQVAERKWYNGPDPVLLSNSFTSGFHSIKYTYDDKNRISIIRYFDTRMQPVAATISLNEVMTAQMVEFNYNGNTLVQEKLYKPGEDSPSKIIDCHTSDYLNTNGVNKGLKRQ
ncbi:MAG: hypothetical protein EKK37_16305 [Sphingobacteriales bacterium]|nr:MAG: hypothetical protein EKK37_16305 [Sphingobacteriales bacterium]